MIIIKGKFEAVSKFIYAIKFYTIKKFWEAKNYAANALSAASGFDDKLNCFIKDLSKLLLLIISEIKVEEALKELVKLAASIPLIPLVWVIMIKYWKKVCEIQIRENSDIFNLPYMQDVPKSKSKILDRLIAIKDDVSESLYLKEVILNTCGFDIAWVQTMWTLENPESFLFTISELKTLSNKIGSIQKILKPISTNEAYKMINDFVTETSNEKLDISGTCASCGHCVSTTCIDNILNFDENVKDIFCHKNVCLATWNPNDISASTNSKFFKRGEHVTLNFLGQAYNAIVLFQRRGFNDEPGKLALLTAEGAGYFPAHPMCKYNEDCPFYTQKHGLYSENKIDYILIEKHDYNEELNKRAEDYESSLNFNSWIGSDHKKLRVCMKCKKAINNNCLPEMSIAESELPVIPPASIKKGVVEYLPEPNLVEKNLTGCFKANTYIIKLIPSLYQRNMKKTAPGINSLGLENRPDLQKASRGHVMTFKMPMEDIRNKFIKDNSIQGPSRLSELESIFKYVIMHPTGQRKKQNLLLLNFQ